MNLTGILTSVFSIAAVIAARYGQNALAGVLQDPSFASNVCTAITAIGTAGALIAGALPGLTHNAAPVSSQPATPTK